MNRLFIIDVSEYNIYENPDVELKSDYIVLYRDLIRGYTTNPFIAFRYRDFLNSALGRYVDIMCLEYEVPKGLSEGEYEDIALELYANFASENNMLGASTCPIIKSHKVDGGLPIYCTDALLKSVNLTKLQRDILYSILYVFDETIRYIFPMSRDESLLNFRQSILDGLTDPSRLVIDPTVGINYYIRTLQFINN